MKATFQFCETPWEKDFCRLAPKCDVFVQKGLKLDTKIYRYTSLDTLLHISSQLEYHICKRLFFTDKNEQGGYRNHKYSFDLCPVGGDASDYCEAYQEYVKEQKIEARDFFVSCWTENTLESYLMWKSYASGGIGIRIETTIGQLLESLKNNQFKIFCARVDYKPEGYKDTWFKRVFIKKEEYRQEHEIRICVSPKDPRQRSCDRLTLKLSNPFITAAILSPFFSILEQKFLLEHMNKSYPQLAISRSQLIEKY